jgi:hypothetical protein
VVKTHYEQDLFVTLDFGHNSADALKVVSDNVERLLEDSVFHHGLTPDVNVRPLLRRLLSLTSLL